MRANPTLRAVYALVTAMSAVLSSCAAHDDAPEPSGHKPVPETLGGLTPARVKANASDLKDTIVTASLDERISPGKNVLWCGTFQLAWNELMDYAGGPVTVQPALPLVDFLNRRSFTKTDIDPDSYFAIAGRMDEGTLEKAKREMAHKFPGWEPELLREAERGPLTGVMMYSFLAKQMPFEYAFERQDDLRFSAEPGLDYDSLPALASFGISDFSSIGGAAKERIRRQVKVIWYEFVDLQEQHFVVELLTKAKEDRLVLALVRPKQTLGQTVSAVMNLMKTPNTLRATDKSLHEDSAGILDLSPEAIEKAIERLSKCADLLDGDRFSAPVVDFDLTQEFPGICEKTLAAKNAKVNGLSFGFAKQQVRFRLDEKGAALKSEAIGGLFGGPTRNFSFCEPFLVMLVRKGASRPYLALWVGNSELLLKAPAKRPAASEPVDL